MTDRFKNICNCGGYAWTMNGRPQEQPHMVWCPQFEEYASWWKTQKEKLGEPECPILPSARNSPR